MEERKGRGLFSRQIMFINIYYREQKVSRESRNFLINFWSDQFGGSIHRSDSDKVLWHACKEKEQNFVSKKFK